MSTMSWKKSSFSGSLPPLPGCPFGTTAGENRMRARGTAAGEPATARRRCGRGAESKHPWSAQLDKGCTVHQSPMSLDLTAPAV